MFYNLGPRAILFLSSALKHKFTVLVKTVSDGGSYECPQSMFFE